MPKVNAENQKQWNQQKHLMIESQREASRLRAFIQIDRTFLKAVRENCKNEGVLKTTEN
jgi:hypothetical protein